MAGANWTHNEMKTALPMATPPILALSNTPTTLFFEVLEGV